MMHPSSFHLMANLLKEHVTGEAYEKGGTVLDIGSMNIHPDRKVNATYRELFTKHPQWEYKGLDLDKGHNVDIVSPNPYQWPVQNDSIPLLVSGQCLEHVPAPWLWMREVGRVVKRGSVAIIIAPWSWAIHRRPVDCYRYLPDGMEFLLGYAGFEVLACGVKGPNCYGVGQKEEHTG